MNLHKVYAGVIAAVLAVSIVIGVAWSQHVRDDAMRDATISTQKTDIAQLQQKMTADLAAAQAQIAAIDKQKQQVIAVPSSAPQIIRELIPTAQPIQQTAAIEKSTPPDAPVAQLTRQNEVDLAQYALSCKQCGIERDQLQAQVQDQKQIADKQKIELDAALKAAKGGSLWQRTKRIAKWGAIFGAIGYVAGRAQR